jgi:hypothetical protein
MIPDILENVKTLVALFGIINAAALWYTSSMSISRRPIIISCVVFILISAGIAGRFMRHDRASIAPQLATNLQHEAQTQFDAPLYELMTWPVPRVDSFDVSTNRAVVGMYSWFGIRVGGVTMSNCLTHTSLLFGDSFECGGGTIEYLF